MKPIPTILIPVALLLSAAPRDPKITAPTSNTVQDAYNTAVEAYIYGYPLVTMEITRRVMTNVVAPTDGFAPMGQFAHLRRYPAATNHEVTAPNADTLYSTAWLDLSKEPYVVGIPDANGRYYLMPMLSAWTDVFQDPGKRTTGTKAQKYVITGPGWNGKIPQGLTEYKSPTNLVWILGRAYCTGTPEDYRAVHAFQDKLSLVPLSAYRKRYTPRPGKVDPNIDTRTAVRDRVNRMDVASYFNMMSTLMQTNPPAAADARLVARMAKIGIVPGHGFDKSRLDPVVVTALEGVPRAGFERIMAHGKGSGVRENGWLVTTKTGIYNADYLQRAFITAIGLGANRPEDAIYPVSETDGSGKPYDGANRTYVMHFAKGQQPPVNAFWSLTMYTPDMFFFENPMNKYTVSPRNILKYNPDGSLDLYVQHDSPGKDKEANWLPAPAGKFVVMLRMYWPKPEVLNGSWKVPPVNPQPGS